MILQLIPQNILYAQPLHLLMCVILDLFLLSYTGKFVTDNFCIFVVTQYIVMTHVDQSIRITTHRL